MTQRLSDFIWLYSRIQSTTFLEELESVNIIGPLDDGSGDLEITPISTALTSAFVSIYSKQLWNSERVGHLKWSSIPNISGCTSSNTFIYTILKDWFQWKLCPSPLCPTVIQRCINSSRIELCYCWREHIPFVLFEITTCHEFWYEDHNIPDARVSGLKFFEWACLTPGCVKSVPSQVFDNLHGFPLRPPHSIAMVVK